MSVEMMSDLTPSCVHDSLSADGAPMKPASVIDGKPRDQFVISIIKKLIYNSTMKND